MKKRVVRIVVGVAIVTALVFAYIYRASYLTTYSRLSHHTAVDRSAIHDWTSSKSVSPFKIWRWARIRWDFWCFALPVTLDKPRLVGDRILVHASVTDRTDTEFLYIFDRDWNFIGVFAIPLA